MAYALLKIEDNISMNIQDSITAVINTSDKNTYRMLTNVCNIFWHTIPKPWCDSAQELYNLLMWKSKDSNVFAYRDWYIILGTHNTINHDTIIEPWVIVAWHVTINHSIKPSIIQGWSFLKDCLIVDSTLESWVIIEWWQYTKIQWSTIWKNTVLFGWAKFRDSIIWPDNEIWYGEFVRTTTWKLMKALHSCYLWDTEVWDNVNIANQFGIVNSWPGWVKSKTIIWNNVFTGGWARIVPWRKWVKVWDWAIIGAWATVLCDIPENHTYIRKDKIYPHT